MTLEVGVRNWRFSPAIVRTKRERETETERGSRELLPLRAREKTKQRTGEFGGKKMVQRNIAVALDYSPSSKVALTWALEYAARHGDHLLLVIVNKLENESGQANLWEANGSPLIPFSDLRDPHIVKTYGLEANSSVYEEVEEAIHLKNLTVVAKVYFGDVQEKIIHAVAEDKSDHLVIGNRNEGGIKRILMGSVSNYVVNNSPCPVTVVKMPDSLH